MPLSCGGRLAEPVFKGLRRQMVLNHCKWDPQIEDIGALCPYPLILNADSWKQLSAWAESLADETLRAEDEMLRRPELLNVLGLPRSVRKLLVKSSQEPTISIARIMRFDFHWTTDGWRISEVNSDVPGGFIESSAFTELVRQALAGAASTGDPARTYVQAIAASGAKTVALVHATSYSDDRQVMVYLSKLLEQLGVNCCLCSPSDLLWVDGRAQVLVTQHPSPVDAIIRFFPAEWLPNLRRSTKWSHFLRGGKTPVSNPAFALISQSKRFPIVWDQLQTPLPTWKALLPVTRDPRHAPWQKDTNWVLKPALGRVGESIGLAGVTPPREWTKICRRARWLSSEWVAQQRFELLPVHGPDGDVYPVIGVYTVDRTAVGVYGRIASRPLIDYLAQDIAVLI